jgi:hypothetical protein
MGNSVPTSGQFKLRFTRERPESSAPTAERDVMAKALNVEATMLGALTRKYSPDPRSNSRPQWPMTCHSTRVSRVESRVFDLQTGILREARGE